ncbi:ATP-dependent DEAD/DEAH box RNA helicase, putative [Bodo saltans]|uniref:ATP-dependent RNA helicase n=1 Tax=Bodo saltans TaxID=75058 RepID=A0A0S4KKU4_BODSA|nr:ATP-dependent DEAD/DEAH box RNA helicase, putative [Bodo saltans]|eukprot:CUI14229.1 ATP-dependent DEAD/DEAH box RNA helicase, putative [Bodo saltans]
MGIKGRKKRERERLAKQAEIAEDRDGEEYDSDDEDAPPPFLVFGNGPFAPPGSAPKMSQSQRFRMMDESVLERYRDDHANRKSSHIKKKRSRDEDEEVDEESLPLMHHFHDAEELVKLSQQQSLAKKQDITGCRFGHPLLGLDERVVTALLTEGFSRMTRIQERVLPLALEGYDILGQAKTGSGKTLAFSIPILHGAQTIVPKSPKSCLALILGPTKELCVQIHQILGNIAEHLNAAARQERSSGPLLGVRLITGGTSVLEERKALQSGSAHIVVGTPGRITDHVRHCVGWKLSTLRYLVLDEADRMLADGFQRDLDYIIGATPKSRQTLLFSATNSKSVHELARLSLSKTPLFIDTKSAEPKFVDEELANAVAPPFRVLQDVVDDNEAAIDEDGVPATSSTNDHAGEDIPSALHQFCALVPVEDRLRALYVFVKRVARVAKAMVFCSTVASTTFHCQMMGSVGFHNEVLMLHGQMKHRQRLATFAAFNEWSTGVLFCTDVAARGLDIPHVSWILQYDPPLDPTEYVHRIGRTARAGNVGNSLIFLTPEESRFIKYLTNFGIHMEAYPVPEKLPRIQEKLEHVLQLDPVVAKSAVIAYRAHVGAYLSHILKETFDVHRIDLDGLAKAFALTSTPNVSLPKTSAEEKQDYVKGKIKSLNKRKGQAIRHYEQMKTKQQWTDDGSFVGMSRPKRSLSM